MFLYICDMFILPLLVPIYINSFHLKFPIFLCRGIFVVSSLNVRHGRNGPSVYRTVTRDLIRIMHKYKYTINQLITHHIAQQ